MSKTDWESIEREYRAGQLSVREIARRFGITEGPIRRKAKALKWKRDLSEKVRAAAQSKLHAEDAGRAGDAGATDAEIVEKAAERSADVIRMHRTDIARGRSLVEAMMGELEDETDHRKLLSELVEQHLDDIGANPQVEAAIRKAISLPTRSGVLRDLSQSMHKLIVLERQAYNLDDNKPLDPLAELFSKVDGLTKGL